VIAFEPSPSILPLLKRNLAANAIQNVEVVELACSDQIGEVEFFVGDHHHISSLDGAWASQGKGRLAPISVGSTTLDAFFYGTKAAPRLPDLIKIDIEGGGVFALKGMDRCLSESRPLVWIESHTPHEDRAISQMILKHGYQAFRLQTGKRVMEPQTTYPNPEGVWGTMLLFPNEKEPVLKRVLL
jgi:FkbM family methyltransferase